MKAIRSGWIVSLVLMFSLCGCYANQRYLSGKEIHGKARYVAVLPLVNLTTYPNAGRIVGDLLSTELYALTPFRLMERTEMLETLKGGEEDLDTVLDKTVALRIGKRLGVDTVIYGSVSEYHYKRGLDEAPVVGINVRMLDVESGKVLWAESRSATGGCPWPWGDSLNRLAQKVCHDMVSDMVR